MPADFLTPLATLHERNGASRTFREIRTRVFEIEEERSEKLRIELAKLADLAQFLEQHEPSWIEFCRAKIWKSKSARARPKLEKPSDALRFLVHELCARIEDRHRRKNRVHLYLSSLRELRAQKVRPAQMPDAIRDAGGIGKLSTAFAERLKRRMKRAGVVEADVDAAEDHKKERPNKPRTPDSEQKALKRPKSEAKTELKPETGRSIYRRLSVRQNRQLDKLLGLAEGETMVGVIKMKRSNGVPKVVLLSKKKREV